MSKLILSAAALMVAASGVGADEANKVSKFDKVMAKYERSGETKRCVSPARLKESQILDNTHILFRVSPKRAYLNKLPRECRALKFDDAISYTVRGGQLCANDTFRVLDMTLRPGASCSFGEFEKIEKKTADSGDKTGAAVGEE